MLRLSLQRFRQTHRYPTLRHPTLVCRPVAQDQSSHCISLYTNRAYFCRRLDSQSDSISVHRDEHLPLLPTKRKCLRETFPHSFPRDAIGFGRQDWPLVAPNRCPLPYLLHRFGCHAHSNNRPKSPIYRCH